MNDQTAGAAETAADTPVSTPAEIAAQWEAYVASTAEALKAAKERAKTFKAALKKLTPTADNADDIARGQAVLAQTEASIVELTNTLASAKESLKAAKAAVKVAAKPVKAEKPAKEPKPEQLKQNGMAYPRDGTISKTLWDIFDMVTAQNGGMEVLPATIDQVKPLAAAAGVVPASILAGYAHWRKFHGITGRLVSPDAVAAKAAKDAEAAAAKAAKDAEKAAAKAAKDAERAAAKAAKDAEKAAAKAAREAAVKAAADAAKAAAEAAAKAAADALANTPA